MAKVKFIFNVEVECEDSSPEVQKQAEYAAARFQEVMEMALQQHADKLKEIFPEGNFVVRHGDEGEEWKSE